MIEALPLLRWSRGGERTAAGETAALMVYIALILMSDEESEELPMPMPEILLGPLPPPMVQQTYTRTLQIAHATYDALQKSTSLSRTLVAAGVARLVELDLIRPLGSHQKRRYLIVSKGKTGGWFKLPSAPIVRNQTIFPFGNFTLRSKHELHALKLYLYLAARRVNVQEFTMVSYENIFERIGVSERDIRKATSLLINSGLLRNVHRESDVAQKHFGPNQYYMTGSDKLRNTDAGQATTSP